MGRPAVFGAADASERASEMFLRTGAFFSSILSEFLKNLVALHFTSRFLNDGQKLKIISEMLQKMDWYQGDMEDEKDEE